MHLTPTQQRIMDVLKDGRLHPSHELKSCVNDELSPQGNLRVHLVRLRKVIRPYGKDVICHRIIDNGQIKVHYYLARLMMSPYDGKS